MNYKWIGWCREDNHDKIWAVICLRTPKHGADAGNYATVWGRRGKKLQTKPFSGEAYQINNSIRAKQKKGYAEIPTTELDRIYPEFETDLEQTAIWAVLGN